MKKFSLVILCILCYSSAIGATLEEELRNYLGAQSTHVGVAIIMGGDTISINGSDLFQMNSVMKMFQAAAVVDKVPLDSVITIQPDEWQTDTWSPLLRENGTCLLKISVSDLLRQSLQESDNNACDFLFNHVLDVTETQAWLTTRGVKGVNICWNEAEMHQEPSRSEDNWCTPICAAEFIDKLYTSDIVKNPQFIRETLMGCTTGMARFPKAFDNTVVKIGHKTGSGFNDEYGNPLGTNDIGFIQLPNGKHYSVAVFVRWWPGNISDAEKVIGDISTLVYKWVMQ